MSDWQAGYDGLMHPPGSNRNAFNAGIAARQHDQSMADMTARHHAAMAQFGQPPPGSAPIAFGGYAGPPSPATIRILKVLAILLIGGLVVGLGVNAIDGRMKESRRAARLAEAAQLQRESDARWHPILGRALARFDTQRDLAAIGQAARLSPCHREVISRLMRGGRLGFVHCPRATPIGAPFRAFVDSDRFSVEYVVTDPTIRTRMNVMPLAPWAMDAGPASGNRSPVATALDRLGAAEVGRHVGRGCLAIDARRYATNLAPDQGSGQRARSDVPASYASLARVTIACPSAGRLRVAASRTYQE